MNVTSLPCQKHLARDPVCFSLLSCQLYSVDKVGHKCVYVWYKNVLYGKQWRVFLGVVLVHCDVLSVSERERVKRVELSLPASAIWFFFTWRSQQNVNKKNNNKKIKYAKWHWKITMKTTSRKPAEIGTKSKRPSRKRHGHYEWKRSKRKHHSHLLPEPESEQQQSSPGQKGNAPRFGPGPWVFI